MQNVFVEKPYEFVAPIQSSFAANWAARLGLFQRVLKRGHGIVSHECRNLHYLRESLDAGHGVMVCANHPRTSDPVVMGHVAREAPCLFYVMASSHLFHQSWAQRQMLRMAGAFSVNREGLDRQAVDYAISVLEKAERPLLIFPEGTTSRTNDTLMSFMDGPSFIARSAAKRRQKQGGKVVVHPIAIRYLFQGDIHRTCCEVLSDIESKLTWRPNDQLPLVKRLIKVGSALLTLKELQYDARPEPGVSLRQRQNEMVDRLLAPLEEEWLGSKKEGGVAIRVKSLRMKIFPTLQSSELTVDQRKTRWKMMEDTYLAQQIDCYPENYLTEFPSIERVLETTEKLEEDLTDRCRVHGKMRVIIDVGPAIEVNTERQRGVAVDPLMNEIRTQLELMLAQSRTECRMFQEGA